MVDNTNTEKRSDRKGKMLLVILRFLLLFAVIFLAFLLMHSAGWFGSAHNPQNGWYDPAAQVGSLPGRTQEEIQEELNKIVEEGMFNISIASIILFDDGESDGQARIENTVANHYNMSVTITLDRESDAIYESKGLAPGQFIENITLARDLPAGEYDATALFTAYTQDTLQQVGQAAAKVTLVVNT